MRLSASGIRSVRRTVRALQAICCAVLLLPGEGLLFAQSAPAQKPAAPAAAPAADASKDTEKDAPKATPDQLDSLVAPIALYPDPLLAQTLVASTYPLEIIQLQQWLAKNPSLKDKALADAVAKQPWDTSIQSMAATPEVVKRLADDIQWTTELGNAFLAQQQDVMDSVQRMRKKAMDKGALESNEQQKVETKTIEQKTVIVVESSNPEVIYVPSYSPVVVYGPPVYPYPPIYYPPYPPGAAFVTFGFGVMVGAAFWGGSCCGCGWGHSSNVNINVNNNFNQINHNGGGNWNHNPQHRGGTPYGDKATNNKYGGGSKGNTGGTSGNRPSAGQQPAGGNRGASAGQQPAGGNRGASAGQQPAGGNRGGAPSASNRASGGAGSPSAGNRSAAGGDKIGGRSVPTSSSKAGGFGGSSGGFSGSSARASSSRGSRSMGGGGGGGRRR